jgi:hypothetical protein
MSPPQPQLRHIMTHLICITSLPNAAQQVWVCPTLCRDLEPPYGHTLGRQKPPVIVPDPVVQRRSLSRPSMIDPQGEYGAPSALPPLVPTRRQRASREVHYGIFWSARSFLRIAWFVNPPRNRLARSRHSFALAENHITHGKSAGSYSVAHRLLAHQSGGNGGSGFEADSHSANPLPAGSPIGL